jgi:hypothetical protein
VAGIQLTSGLVYYSTNAGASWAAPNNAHTIDHLIAWFARPTE